MVGWTRRSRESRERHERWLKWYWSLSAEERDAADQRADRELEATRLWAAAAVLVLVAIVAVLAAASP